MDESLNLKKINRKGSRAKDEMIQNQKTKGKTLKRQKLKKDEWLIGETHAAKGTLLIKSCARTQRGWRLQVILPHANAWHALGLSWVNAGALRGNTTSECPRDWRTRHARVIS